MTAAMPSAQPAANLLDRETSPYLLQHKDNPVHWRPWGREALAEAAAADKPILLSVGYAACHWCHVMAHESFEDPATAAVMNQRFVNIKVDREERPDIDALYMMALHLMNIPGGWPMTMFLTPKGEPFWGGTYFPKDGRFGQPAFIDILHRVDEVYRTAPDRVARSCEALTAGLKQLSRPPKASPGADVITAADLAAASEPVLNMIDPVHGGFGGAPKFPQTGLIDLLWRAHRRNPDEACRTAVISTLSHMAQGGLYDHLGGGFARYSVDDMWLVPHFEKMLDDNALILARMVEVWRETRSPLFEARIRETVAWVLEDMTCETGGFAASIGADSQGEEGRFYVWSAAEVDSVLSPDEARLFKELYDVQPSGNWDGVCILNRLGNLDLQDRETEARLSAARQRLRAARAKRPAPALDDKILADWNGLMIHALTDAGMAFDEPDWIAAARRAFDFVVRHMGDGAALAHSWRLGEARHMAMADDYAAMASAAITLHEATGEAVFLDHAQQWTDHLNTHFWDRENGGYFQTSDKADALIVRSRNPFDSASPNANGLMLDTLARLFALTGQWAHRNRADALVAAFISEAKQAPQALAAFWNGFDTLLNLTHIVIVGRPDDRERAAMARIARQAPVPGRVLQVLPLGADLPPGHPVHGKTNGSGGTRVFVCRDGRCSLPMRTADDLAAALAKPAGS
ncbi:MAG: thioredoxin domain-containing protein [Alphaproteobacteria bacterium]